MALIDFTPRGFTAAALRGITAGETVTLVADGGRTVRGFVSAISATSDGGPVETSMTLIIQPGADTPNG